MDMQLVFGVVTCVAAIVFVVLYLKEVWKNSSDRVERDTYEGIRSTREHFEREISKLKAEMESFKQKQTNKYEGCHYYNNKENDHKSTTKTTR